jgi:hypothetical protein
MTNTEQWSVRLERRPHRDAVRRLREAYRKLWQLYGSRTATGSALETTQTAQKAVQEV